MSFYGFYKKDFCDVSNPKQLENVARKIVKNGEFDFLMTCDGK